MQIKGWYWKDSNSYKQVRPQCSAWATNMLYISILCIPPTLWPLEMWGETFVLILLPVLLRALLWRVVLPAESVKGFHVCLQYKCIWGLRKNVTMGLKSKINTDVLDTHMVSLQVRSSMFSESCSQRCSGPINFTVTYQERRVKTCEEEGVQGGTKHLGIHAVTSPHLGCGFDWQRGENGSRQD